MVMCSHRIKGWTTDEAFWVLQEHCFLWERGVDADFGLPDFQDLLHAEATQRLEEQ